MKTFLNWMKYFACEIKDYPGRQFRIHASYLEIYNEEIRDLLATEKNLRYDVKMADTKGTDVYVTNLKVQLPI